MKIPIIIIRDPSLIFHWKQGRRQVEVDLQKRQKIDGIRRPVIYTATINEKYAAHKNS